MPPRHPSLPRRKPAVDALLDIDRDAANLLIREIDIAQTELARAAIGTPWESRQFRSFVREASSQANCGDWPVAVTPTEVLDALSARSHTVRLSRETAAKQAIHHSDVRPEDYAVVHQILDRGSLFKASERHLVGFLEWEGRMWRAVIKVTADQSETYLASLHKAKDRDFTAARRRLKGIDREG